GLLCLFHHPEYLLDIKRLGEMAGFEMTENHLSSSVMVLGCANLFMAVLISTTRMRLIAGQMALMALVAGLAKGLATAQTDGWLFATPRMMLTAMVAGAPLALMVFWGRESELKLSRRARAASRMQSGWFARLFYRTAAINAMAGLALVMIIILNETGTLSFKPDKLNLQAFDFLAVDRGAAAPGPDAPDKSDASPTGITWKTGKDKNDADKPESKSDATKTNASEKPDTRKKSPDQTQTTSTPKATKQNNKQARDKQASATPPSRRRKRRLRRTERVRIEFFGSTFDDDKGSAPARRVSSPLHDELDRELSEARRDRDTGRLEDAKAKLEAIKARAPSDYPLGPVNEELRKVKAEQAKSDNS
ncbi:MAG: hypothetical protein R3236_07220, partial [Phycisphaeraceae bacterium]|nr:hypothetical protein [Phycisphaeraceae bacterium]